MSDSNSNSFSVDRRKVIQSGSILGVFGIGVGAWKVSQTESSEENEEDQPLQLVYTWDLQEPFIDGSLYLMSYKNTMINGNYDQGRLYLEYTTEKLSEVGSFIGERRDDLVNELSEEQDTDLMVAHTHLQEGMNYAMQANEERLAGNEEQYNELLEKSHQSAVKARETFPEDPFN